MVINAASMGTNCCRCTFAQREFRYVTEVVSKFKTLIKSTCGNATPDRHSLLGFLIPISRQTWLPMTRNKVLSDAGNFKRIETKLATSLSRRGSPTSCASIIIFGWFDKHEVHSFFCRFVCYKPIDLWCSAEKVTISPILNL